MRVIILSLVLMTLLIVGGTLATRAYVRDKQSTRIQLSRVALQRIKTEADYRVALGEIDATRFGHARHIDANWFEVRPENHLLFGDERPWLEVATGDDLLGKHPTVITGGDARAAFWYNPAHGVVRARVPIGDTEAETIDLYNLLNETELAHEQVVWAPRDWVAPLPDEVPGDQHANGSEVKHVEDSEHVDAAADVEQTLAMPAMAGPDAPTGDRAADNDAPVMPIDPDSPTARAIEAVMRDFGLGNR